MSSDKYKHVKHGQDDLEKFISCVDLCRDISHLVYQLHVNGHVHFKKYIKKTPCSLLVSVKKELSDMLQLWLEKLKSSRKAFYGMNFFKGKHIHVLDDFFEGNCNLSAVNALIQFIHPNLCPDQIKLIYRKLKLENPNCDQLQLIGESFHQSMMSVSQFKRCFPLFEAQKTNVSEVIEDRKLFVARIDEKSTIMVRSVLALFLKATDTLPEPNQLLFCSRETTWGDIRLLLGRCYGAYDFYKTKTLFCLTNIELLSSEVQLKLIEEFKNMQERNSFNLAVVCQCQPNHYLMDELSEYVLPLRSLSDDEVRDLLKGKFPGVSTYTSEVSGLGKTSSILKLASELSRTVKTLHISGQVLRGKVVESLLKLNIGKNDYLHIDIGNVDNPMELDQIMFELIILKYVDTVLTSVELQTDFVAIEIGNTIKDNLRDSLTTTVLFQRVHLKWKNYEDFVVSAEINSPVQVVCHYLQALETGDLDKTDIYFSGKNAVSAFSDHKCRIILRQVLSSTCDTSFSTVNIFLSVLADQLKRLSVSTFFRTACISDMVGDKTVPAIRSSMVKALAEVAKEFACRSVSAYRSAQRDSFSEPMKADNRTEITDATQKTIDLASAASNRVVSMIRWDDSNHLIFVFHNQNVHTISAMYRDISKVPIHVKDLFEGQLKKPLPNFRQLNPDQLLTMLQKISRHQPSLPDDELQKITKHYALTPDNLLKMVLIMLRIKARIPVLIMGETGCGKTSLIRYLAAICEIPFDVISIHAGIEEGTLISRINENNERALRDFGVERWVFFDEINTSESIGFLSEVLCHHLCNGNILAPNLVFMAACNPYKLRSEEAIFTSGLKSRAKTDELSRLVYRVHPLPEKLVDYVWDFGSLSENDEKLYIERMVSGILKTVKHEKLFVDLVAMSQSYTRHIAGTTSCVSLRDVERCKILLCWFLGMSERKITKGPFSGHPDKVISCIILTMAHCYQTRFEKTTDRQEYLKKIEHVFEMHEMNDFTGDLIYELITEEQKNILARMELPPGTAENIALQENVFVLLVCILTKIPIFLVGKPGSSKSLSMQVIKSNMRGKDSKDEFFKTLPQLYCVSFQGTESSTSDGIIKVFEKAENYQKANIDNDVLSVVVLDEIGLAEVSRFNPLKVLHNLLEIDGLKRPSVAVVGISNWCLDESKMNRAIHLSRPEMDLEDLYRTAESISKSFELKELTVLEQGAMGYRFQACDIKKDLERVSSSYVKYIREMKFENFHGLRDYYSLVKYFTRELSLMETFPNESDIQDKITVGVHRNFGGLPEERDTLTRAFMISQSENKSVLGLIKDNVLDGMARHLMLITTGESVLGILEKELDSIHREKREVLFGSQFEDDLTDDYNYRILSRIILCMEQGLVLILKDLESVYESLYDMLNKNYTELGKNKICRVALGAHSNPFCRIHEDFRCIVLVDKNDLKYTDPPFLSRFEKQCLTFSDIISKEQQNVIDNLESWINSLVSIENKDFSKDDCFPIYSKDMVASLVLKFDRECNIDEDQLILNCKKALLQIARPEAIVRLTKAKDKIIQKESNWIQDYYYKLPLHGGLAAFIEYQLGEKTIPQKYGVKTVIFTNSSVHSKGLKNITPRTHRVEKLGAFKSEKQLSLHMQGFWLESDIEILILLCSAEKEKHILLAKSVIERYRKEFIERIANCVKHVYLVVHVDRNTSDTNISSAINYLSGWELFMLDSIECPRISLPQLCQMTLKEAVKIKKPMNNYIKNKLAWALSRINYPKYGRTVKSLTRLLERMKECEEFIDFLDNRIYDCILETHPDANDMEWQVNLSCDVNALKTSATFVEALEKYICSVIDAPLAKLIFKLEDANALDSFLIEDTLTEKRRYVWKKTVLKEEVISIVDIPNASGPESYNCESNEIFLKLPFSMYIFNAIETTKEEFMNSVALVRARCDIDEEEELPETLFAQLLSHQECLVLDKIPDLTDFIHSTDDYVHDFCNILSYSTCLSLYKKSRIDVLKFILDKKVDFSTESQVSLLTKLHTCYWMNYHVFCGAWQLLEYCFSEGKMSEDIKIYLDEKAGKYENNKSTSGKESMQETKAAKEPQDTAKPFVQHATENHAADSESSEDHQFVENQQTTDFSFTDEMVDFICRRMLPTSQTIKRHEGVECWLGNAHTVLTLVSNVSSIPESIDTLCFCKYVCAEILIPGNLDCMWLTKLADSLSDGQVDSHMVLDIFMQMVASVPLDDENMHKKCLKVLSKVSVKCLIRYPYTPAIPFIVSSIKEGKIPDKYTWLFKTPLQLALKLACVDQPKVFSEILSGLTSNQMGSSPEGKEILKQYQNLSKQMNENTSKTNENLKAENEECVTGKGQQINDQDTVKNETSEIFIDERCLEMNIVNLLDSCLKHLNDNGQQCQNLCILIVDMLQEIYEKNSECKTETLSMFLQCHKSISGSSGVQRLACTAFAKTFLEKMGKRLQTSDLSEEMKQSLRAAFLPMADDSVSRNLASFFLKLLASDLPLSFFYRKFIRLKESLGSLGGIEWKEEDFLDGFEFCPLLAFIPSKTSFLKTLLKPEKEKMTLEDRIKSFVSESKTSPSGKVSLFAIATRYFYLVRPFQVISDTRSAQADLLIDESQVQELDKPAYQLIERLLGKKKFAVDMFMIQEGSKSVECILSSWMTTLFGVLVAHNSNPDNETLPFMTRCLLKPTSVKLLFFPGFPDNRMESRPVLYLKKPSILVTCECGHRLVILKDNKLECHICKKDLQKIHFVASVDIVKMPQTGYIRTSSLFQKIRCLSPLSHQILQLMVKGCLLGSLALDFCDKETLEEAVDETDVALKFWKDSIEHFESVSKLLNVDQATTGLILHFVLLKATDLICINNVQMDSSNERHEWEKQFEEIVIDVLSNPFQNIKNMLQTFHSNLKSVNNAELLLRELENSSELFCCKDLQVQSLFRLTGRPSMMNLVQNLLCSSERYPFLVHVIQNKDLLHLPKYISSLIRWHMMVTSKVSYLLKKQELLRMTVADFIWQFGRKDQTLKNKFSDFKHDWNEMRDSLVTLKLVSDLQRVTHQTNIASCLYIDDDSTMYRILEILVEIQNDFLDTALQIGHWCESVRFLRRGHYTTSLPHIEITEANKQNLIDLKFDEEIIDRDGQCDLDYHKGRQVHYDIRSIEKELAVHLLVGKAHIGLKGSIPTICFTDELFRNYVSLVNTIKASVPQESLSSQLQLSIRTNHENNPKMAVELLTYVGMAMTWLKKTKGDPQRALVDYVDTWKAIFTDAFPKELLPSPQDSILLGHIVALHEILEELCADSILESLEVNFRQSLDFGSENVLHDLVKYSPKAAEILRGTLKRFIYRCLTLRDVDADIMIMEYLKDISFWPDDVKVENGIVVNSVLISMDKVIPSDLTVGHIYFTMMTLEKEFKIMLENELKITQIASSYQSQKTPRDIAKDQRKKVLRGYKKRL